MTEAYPQPEETDITCQFCGKQTPIDYNFCVECDNQIKCLECGKKTYPGKTYCLACSKPLVIRPATNQAPNQYERDVKQDGDKYEEHTRFALSDKAVHEIAPFIVNQTMPGAKVPNIPTPPGLSNGQPIDTAYEDLTPKEGTQKDTEKNNRNSSETLDESQSNNAQSTDQKILSQFFQSDGNFLVAIDNDFKGQNWAEQQRYFIVLFTKAYKELFGKPVPDKEVIRNAAAKLNLVDPNNFTNHLNKTITASMTAISSGLILNAAGEREFNKIIKQMTDTAAKAGYNYWNRPVGTSAPSSYVNKEEKEKVFGWAKEPVNLGQLEIRDVTTARDYALLAFWIVTHHLKKANSIKWNEAMLYLTTKYDTTSVTGNAFRKAMTSKESDKYFTKSGEGSYYLTTDGQKLVESWISGKVSVKKPVS